MQDGGTLRDNEQATCSSSYGVSKWLANHLDHLKRTLTNFLDETSHLEAWEEKLRLVFNASTKTFDVRTEGSQA